MANTTNFGWETPDDTDLVKDGASAMRTLGNAIDTSLVDLKGGTTGQVLSKASNTDMDFTWVAQDDSNAIQNAIVDAKGDLISATAADTPARLAVGTNGQVLTADSTTATGLKWATPATAITWTQRLAPFGTKFSAVAFDGTSTYVAIGQSGALYSSTDNGITWTSRTSGFGTNDISWVHYANGLFVAVGQNGTITTSSDGTTWTARTSNMGANTINFVTYANSIWVAVGSGGGTTNTGGITYSTDGTTWTRKSQSISTGSNYYMAVWNGTNWIVGTDAGSNNYLYATTPSGTWTAAIATAATNDLTGLWFDGTRTILYFATGNNFHYTTGTTLASLTAYNNTNSGGTTTNTKEMYYYYNGNIYTATGAYLTNWNTTPSNNYPSTYSMFTFSPVNYLSSSGGVTATRGGQWAGSTGRIITGGTGGIWTSF